ncbi:CCA tRNA nucleotidyltransferase [Candidatus Microgenomates bacterium]|nr:MAG: CCA tRNA nucleotidyltransferase [Candidatus Microgenomates bacterium]
MISAIPEEIISIYKKIQEAGFEIYFVGGSVRNLLMKREIKDWDLTTNATPNELLKIFPEGFYDNKFGTVGVPFEITQKQSEFSPHQNIAEITTFRTEREYKDRRHPEIVEWGKTIEDDLSRRDFTINAIALQCHSEHIRCAQCKLREESQKDASALTQHDNRFTIIDPFGGQKDIENKIIRAVGDPKKRFKEDALRLLRAIRLATELSFIIEENTLNELIKDASLIKEISGERIKTELLRIIGSDYSYEGIMLLKNSGLLEYIIPELLEGIDISQARPGRHHTTDVFTHNIMSLKYTPSKDPIVRFAALIHDIGKPRVAAPDEEGLITFYNHEMVSAKMAREITDRLKFSRKERDRVVNLIRWHMFTVNEHITDAAVRRFIRRVGVENVKDIVDLRIGDRLGGGTQTAQSWRLKKFKERVEEQLKPAPFSINDMAIDGKDVMKELNIPPGPKVGEILQKLFEEADEDLEKNNKEYLLKRIKEIGKET